LLKEGVRYATPMFVVLVLVDVYKIPGEHLTTLYYLSLIMNKGKELYLRNIQLKGNFRYAQGMIS
jgi:hypothetical protein